MPPPKSPLDKPSPSQARRPSASRHSSSDKTTTKSAKHGVKPTPNSPAKGKDSMSELSSGTKAPSKAQPKSEIVSENTRPAPETATPRSPTLSRSDANEPASVEPRREDVAYDKKGEYNGPPGSNRGNVPRHTAAEEVKRLRTAMDAQLQLTQHRERLEKQLGGREVRGNNGPASANASERTWVSPIHEETTSLSSEEALTSPSSGGLNSASTDSAKTIRGGVTPGPKHVRTPSYPFPSMRTPGPSVLDSHRPFTALSPTVNPSNYAGGTFDNGAHDQVMSGSVTPASTLRFQPQGSSVPDDPIFETPDLYDLSLLLSSEPGLDPWWTNVVQIMRTLYHAHRVTLSVPADSTDIENVPWGQKATFNVIEEHELSLTYLPRGSSMVPSSADTNETSNSDDTNPLEGSQIIASSASTPQRPGLQNRHSFTAYEDTKRDTVSSLDVNRTSIGRPIPLTRAKSYLSGRPEMPPRTATLQNAQLSLQSLQDHMAFEDAKSDAGKPNGAWHQTDTNREVSGRVFSILQALDYETEPLIDNKGVSRVLERGHVIALTRDYPYLDNPSDEKSGGSKAPNSQRPTESEKSKKSKSPDVGSRISSFLGNRPRRPSRGYRSQTSDKGRSMPTSTRTYESEDERQPTPKYEEYEQPPPSPWAQSPAPSPAVRAETAENPFFANIRVDPETFNPRTTPLDYTEILQPETIGVDKSWTVLHIPLIHPLLSKPVQTFRLDAAAIESKSVGRWKRPEEPRESVNEARLKNEEDVKRHTPIAILSILSPVIPYPSSLRHSLENLAPHLATSFSLCRHYSNLETEIAGLSRKRPQANGFGAVVPDANLAVEDMHLRNISFSSADECGPHNLTGGSITSPSDYSAVSRSTAGSPGGIPNWDPSNVGLSIDKGSAGASPSYTMGESYFSTSARPGIGRVDTGSAASITGARHTPKELSPTDFKSARVSRPFEERSLDPEAASWEERDNIYKEKLADDPHSSNANKQENRPQRPAVDNSENREASPSRQAFETVLPPRRVAMRTASNQGLNKAERAPHTHTQLHSYGADFGATFQSLSTTSAASTKASSSSTKPHYRSGSISMPVDYMPPPSDRVKGIMLDSLPMHIFIAVPPTGEIVWVNNRYLTYRGQSVKDLHEDPWASIHPEERDAYLKSWSHAIRTGQQFSMQVRLKRFDGAYRWFYTRAIGLQDSRGVIVQWYGTHMDIHDQHIAEVKAARQEEIEASEAKHKQLANLIPQIIFSATEDEGVTFANEQWLSYTGQDFNDALGLGFMDYVHPEDLAKCHIPFESRPTPSSRGTKKPPEPSRHSSQMSSSEKSTRSNISEAPTETTIKGIYQSLSRTNSSGSGSVYEFPTSDLSELARTGVVKVDMDSNGRTSYSTEVRLRSRTGEYRWHLVRCVEVDNIILGSEGRSGSWFGACADINDHKLLEMKLKEAMESKSKFLSNMSHEIRTPLIGISGMISFLQDTPLDDEQIDYCNTIASSAEGLLNIINDILDLAKADAGMMKLSYDWFHTRSLVEEVNEMVSTLAITKHLEVNYMVDSDVPEIIKGDRFRIRQVLLNVIGNAIKFTTVGEVFSRCKVVTCDTSVLQENEVMLEFSIVDTGRGFTQQEAEMIFKPFSQIDGSSTRSHGGTGLGLVISRQFVELHGGKMEGTAIPGKGSTFTFTAIFGLPTALDHPGPPATPGFSMLQSVPSLPEQPTVSRTSTETSKEPASIVSSTIESPESSTGAGHETELSITESPAVASSSSSEPSLRSTLSQTTQKSSDSSFAQPLTQFSEAARDNAPDPSNMKLAIPKPLSPPASGSSSTKDTVTTPPGIKQTMATSKIGSPLSRQSTPELKHVRPPMYSILIICPQTHSREATTQHIEMTLPKDVPHQITALASIDEARKMIVGANPIIFTHIVLNLGLAEEVVALIDQIVASILMPSTSIVILSDPVQRQEVIKMTTAYDYDQLAKDNRVNFIYKPVKPSRFAVIFDPDKERDLSTDRNRSSAQQQVANQRQNYLDIAKRLGNKGHNVLLVEDNATNQKVLLKFLSKVGIAVELALDGVECTEKVFSHDHSFYSLILCDLHMPNKDGYQACREIRAWERRESFPRIPIIALSANVMADVLDKCIEAGFSNYITKPVDFKALSTVMGDLLDPAVKPEAAAKLMLKIA